MRLENVIVVWPCGRAGGRARVREWGRVQRPKTFKLKTLDSPLQ